MSATKRKVEDVADAVVSRDDEASRNDGVSAAEPVKHHNELMAACMSQSVTAVHSLLESAVNEGHKSTGEECSVIPPKQLLAATQDPVTGLSPLMLAAKGGSCEICTLLLEAGAPWNAVDRFGKCAGDFATDNEKWDVVNLLVDAATKAELILGASIGATIRLSKQLETKSKNDDSTMATEVPISHQPCTKPDYYVDHNVRYNAANTILLDGDDDAVMMEWERPLMNAHASILTNNGTRGKRVLNIGFGLGIIDSALQSYEPSLHVICEAHPTVYKKMVDDGWDKKPNVRICFGKWQDELPKLLQEGLVFDGIFYDTYGEHFTDLEDFHSLMAGCLAKPNGIYSFFNGLAPDNLFFHGVACNCVKIQLEHIGLDTEFAQCQIQVDEKDWDGVRRKYWHGRETYYLPVVTWSKTSDKMDTE
mmetsp:Transcript_29023/g.69137  ORF Transcript_29023/g.69137 Transcript_29023/m.69137 type:complete len:420 (+) Transcript_29023:68-1327(+)